MPLTVVPELPADDRGSSAGPAGSSLIDQIVREGARKMLAAALQAEVDDYIAAFVDERVYFAAVQDRKGHFPVIGSGLLPAVEPRRFELLTSCLQIGLISRRNGLDLGRRWSASDRD